MEEDDIIVALCIIIIARAADYKKKTKKMDSFMDSKKANTWSLPCINARTVDRRS